MAIGIEDKIKALEEKLKQAKAQKAKIEARQKAIETKVQRSQDTRRKVLAGAMVLEMMERDEATRQRFMERLDKYLTRADDRALFDLQVTATQSPKEEASEH